MAGEGGETITLGDRLAALAARLARPVAAPDPAPAPLRDGDPDRAARLAGGVLRFGADEAGPRPRAPFFWTPPTALWRDALHEMAWLDDAAAAARADRATLRDWAWAWLARGGFAASPPGARGAARRLRALLAAWPVLVAGAGAADQRRWRREIARHLAFLERRQRATRDPLARLEAAASLAVGLTVCAAQAPRRRRALRALEVAAETAIDGDGGVAARDPTALARTVCALAWAGDALAGAGAHPPPGLGHALARAAPALRALRLGDGSLLRIHGSGAGGEDAAALDVALARIAALAPAGARGRRRDGVMGVARIAAGRAVALIDAAAPPPGAAATASALALTFSVGRVALLGSVGPADGMGPDWRLAARATAAFSAVEVAGASSARLAPDRGAGRARPFAAAARVSGVERAEDDAGRWFRASHDGYAARFGLTVTRRLRLGHDGATLACEDTLHCADAAARRRFDAAARAQGGMPFCVRFHIDPTVEARAASDGAVTLDLPDGSTWTLTAAAGALTLTDGVRLDAPDGVARPAPQAVVSGMARDYWGRAVWTLRQTRPRAAAARRRRPRDAASD